MKRKIGEIFYVERIEKWVQAGVQDTEVGCGGCDLNLNRHGCQYISEGVEFCMAESFDFPEGSGQHLIYKIINPTEEQMKDLSTELPDTTTVPKISKESWTSRDKKNSVMTFKNGKKTTSLPIMYYLKRLGLSLPKIEKDGRQVFHFEELKWAFMKGTTRQESQENVDSYAKAMWEIYFKAYPELRPAPKVNDIETSVEQIVPQESTESKIE